MFLRSLARATALMILTTGTAFAARSDGIDSSILAPGLVQAREALDRLDRLIDEAHAIGIALFRVHNEFGEQRAAMAAAAAARPPANAPKGPPPPKPPAAPDCTTPWLLDLGARSREFGRGFRDAVQSTRVQGRRVENITVEPTVQPLLDPETNHRITSLLARVDDLVRSYPEAASWQERYVEPLLKGCEPALVPAAGIPDAAPPAIKDGISAGGPSRKPRLIAILAFGGGWLCPGAVPAAGVMLVSGDVCYSASESCDCEPAGVSPATVLGPDANAGSAN
ncbi:MAG: hypothetical protein ABR587_07555 [Candidatus Binatia bacterium]